MQQSKSNAVQVNLGRVNPGYSLLEAAVQRLGAEFQNQARDQQAPAGVQVQVYLAVLRS